MVRKSLLFFSAALLLIASEGKVILHEAVAEEIPTVTNSSLVFLKSSATAEEKLLFSKDAKLNPQGNDDRDIEFYVVDMPPDEARAYTREKFEEIVDHVEANPVYGFFPSGCGVPQNLPATSDPSDSIVRMGGPLTGAIPARKAWIIDTGIDIDSRLLNIEFTHSAVCNKIKCTAANTDHSLVADDPSIGHGTVIAGIIAGRAHPEGATGTILGMLPGAIVVPVKVVFPMPPEGGAAAATNAINWVLDRAAVGDVVNISWGATVDPANAGDPYSGVEAAIISLANKGVNVAIAAGNFDRMGDLSSTGGYVELVTPARVGGYRSTSGGGAIVTISAIDEADDFWFVYGANPFGSAFGNGLRPDFSAPGSNVSSIFPGGLSATCTGTSFSAAHVSGALLQRNTIAVKPDGPSGSDVDGDGDIIATCDDSSGSCAISP